MQRIIYDLLRENESKNGTLSIIALRRELKFKDFYVMLYLNKYISIFYDRCEK